MGGTGRDTRDTFPCSRSNKAGAAWQQPAMCAWHWAGHTGPCSRSDNGNGSRVMRLRTITKCHRWEGQMALLVAALSQSAQHLLQCSLSDGANPISMELQNASRHCGVSMCWIVLQRKPPTAGLVTPLAREMFHFAISPGLRSLLYTKRGRPQDLVAATSPLGRPIRSCLRRFTRQASGPPGNVDAGSQRKVGCARTRS